VILDYGKICKIPYGSNSSEQGTSNMAAVVIFPAVFGLVTNKKLGISACF